MAQRTWKRILMSMSVAMMVALLAGCTPVKPWQRGVLTKYEMQNAPDALDATLTNHIYFAKEASTGGDGAGGGGCGCN